MSASATVDQSTLSLMREEAQSLVVRARAGDQCALAMIARVRESVPTSRRAAAAYELLREYVLRNPVGRGLSDFAGALRGSRSPMATLGAAATRRGVDGRGELVRCIERLPTDLDSYARAACMVADGKMVSREVVCRSILPHLRGDAVAIDGVPFTLGAAHRAGKRIASEWIAEWGKEGDLRATSNGMDVGFRHEGVVLPSLSQFVRAFNAATYADDVREMATPLPSAARQPIRVGYVFGLARAIQRVTRNEEPISQLSDLVSWELGE